MKKYDEAIAVATDHLAWRANVKGDRPMEQPMRIDAQLVLDMARDARRYAAARDVLCTKLRLAAAEVDQMLDDSLAKRDAAASIGGATPGLDGA